MNLTHLDHKLEEIGEELRRLGLWQHHPPHWVACYGDPIGPDFPSWLQFIYIPNKRQYGQRCVDAGLAPQAITFFNGLSENSCLLQLLVELDGMI